MKFDTAIIIGAGAFGTSIASILSNNFNRIILKVRSEDVYQSIKTNRENSIYLSGMKLKENILPALTWEEVGEQINGEVQLIVSGLPTSALKSYFLEHKEFLSTFMDKQIPFVSLSKGIDPNTLELPDDLLLHSFAQYKDQLVFLSGPSFAHEIMNKQITVVSIAGRSKKVLENVCTMMDTNYFRTLPNYDVKGVLLGGSLKNILAIAGGIIEGLGFNHNTRAAMITRGIAEMLRFGKVLNARPETFYGMSGMGDLILTTTGDLSRNKVFGLKIAQGMKPLEIINSQRSVVEGYKTARAAHLLSEKYDIRARIFNGVYSVLYEETSTKDAIENIMTAPTRFETD